MKRPLAYITAAWSGNEYENAETAARYCRQVYEAGYSPLHCGAGLRLGRAGGGAGLPSLQQRESHGPPCRCSHQKRLCYRPLCPAPRRTDGPAAGVPGPAPGGLQALSVRRGRCGGGVRRSQLLRQGEDPAGRGLAEQKMEETACRWTTATPAPVLSSFPPR